MRKVLLVSQSQRTDGFGRQPGYVGFLEAEEILAQEAGADVALVAPGPGDTRIRIRRVGGRLLRQARGSMAPLPILNRRGGRHPSAPPLSQDHYDVALFVGLTPWDMPLLERMADVRRRADRIVVWMPEVWAIELERRRIQFEAFDLADTIFVGMAEAAERLDGLVRCPVHHLPLAVDARRFAAVPPDEARPIDVLGIGRREPELHQALLAWSRKANRLYLYDTISGGSVPDPGAHRENLADHYRRSSVAITNYAKWDKPDVIGAQRELPGRLWEGLASGAHLIGMPPDEELQTLLLGRPVVASLPDTPSAAVEAIHEAVIADDGDGRRARVQIALRGHDWAHRWSTILERSGLTPPPGLTSRVEALAAQADSLDELS